MPEISPELLRALICGDAKSPCHSATPNPQRLKPVLVTTEFRGVFFGYAADTSGSDIKLKDARNCLYWSSDVGGFLGLANSGPSSKCRIGPTADIDLRKVTCVAEVTPAAETLWRNAPCYKG